MPASSGLPAATRVARGSSSLRSVCARAGIRAKPESMSFRSTDLVPAGASCNLARSAQRPRRDSSRGGSKGPHPDRSVVHPALDPGSLPRSGSDVEVPSDGRDA
jgi:hypothetical protein